METPPAKPIFKTLRESMEILLGGSCIIALTLGMFGLIVGGVSGFLIYAAAAFGVTWLALGPFFVLLNGAVDVGLALQEQAQKRTIRAQVRERAAGQLSAPSAEEDGALSLEELTGR